jgi:hypothetical protein
MNMLNDRDDLALYRLLEFPHETAQSLPMTRTSREERPVPYLRFLRDWRGTAKAAKKSPA